MRGKLILSGVAIIVFGGYGITAGEPVGSGHWVPTAADSANVEEKGINAIRREPPPQAYADCSGKKAGDTVQHMTREGKVAATCVDSAKGLVARPNRPPGSQYDNQPMQGAPPQGANRP